MRKLQPLEDLFYNRRYRDIKRLVDRRVTLIGNVDMLDTKMPDALVVILTPYLDKFIRALLQISRHVAIIFN